MRKKIILLLLVIVTAVMSCKKKLEDLNTDTKNTSQVPSESLFSNATKALVDQETTPSVNLNVFRAFSQYWTETTYTDESRYNVLNRKIPDNEFAVLYRDVLRDLKEAKSIVDTKETDVIATAPVRQNKAAILEILTVFTFQRAVDIFGNVPYEKSLDINNLLPAYDDAKGIYVKLFARLDAAIANLNTSAAAFPAASDIIYGGNIAKWKAFANSLKLKMAITVADVSDMNPAAIAASAVTGGVFTSASQNASFQYLSASPNTNPVYANVNGRSDWVAANTLVDMMNNLKDPRRSKYFDSNMTDTAGNVVYIGGIYGAGNVYDNFTQMSPSLVKTTRPGIILDYTEVQFYLAEAASRGWSVGGTAEKFYNEAITSSILFWSPTTGASEAALYLANPDVAFTTAQGTDLQKIATQAWLAYYDRGGLISWTTWRRLDAPKLNLPPNITDIPTRFTYPIAEQTVNGDNYHTAATAIGGDKLTTKLFWDRH